MYKTEKRNQLKIYLVHLLPDEKDYIDDSFVVVFKSEFFFEINKKNFYTYIVLKLIFINNFHKRAGSWSICSLLLA